MVDKTTSFEGHAVQYQEAGAGFPLLLLHGVGPGTSIAGNFGPVLEPLAEHFHVFGVDLIGFGASARRATPPYFDVELWVRQGLAMLDLLPPGPVGVVGHSLGGALAIKIAARANRVTKVLTSSSIGAPFKLTQALDRFWTIPDTRDALIASMSPMAHDQSALTDQMIDMRWNLLTKSGYAGYFVSMFEGDRQALLDQATITAPEAAAFTSRLLMLHGFNDHACPAEQTSVPVAARLGGDANLLGHCGHNLPRERTADYLQAAIGFLNGA